MNRLHKISFLGGLFLLITSSVYGMIDLSVPLPQHSASLFFKEVDKALLSDELRAFLAPPDWKMVELTKFKTLLKKHPWLVDYVAYDGLTIGEYIVTVCKEEYTKAGSSNYPSHWLKSIGPSSLVAPFEFVIAVLKEKCSFPLNSRGSIITTNNTLNKVYYCTLAEDNDEMHHKGVQLLAAKVYVQFFTTYTNKYKRTAVERNNLAQALERLSSEELALVKKAHEFAFFSSQSFLERVYKATLSQKLLGCLLLPGWESIKGNPINWEAIDLSQFGSLLKSSPVAC